MKEYREKESGKKVYMAAVYLRLSKEDGDVCDGSRKEENNSITNQKENRYEIQFTETANDAEKNAMYSQIEKTGKFSDKLSLIQLNNQQ